MKFWTRDRGEQPRPEKARDEAQDARPSATEVVAVSGGSAVAELVSDDTRWVGFIDKIDRAVIHGWCTDRARPMASIAVEAVGSGGGHFVSIASLFRQDVKDGGFGSGHHGFELSLAGFDDSESVIVRFVESGRSISTAPIALDPVEALLTNVLPDCFAQAALQLVQAVHVRHVALHASADDSCVAEPYEVELIVTHDPARDPDGLITRFTAQECARIVRGAFDLDMAGSLQERLGVLHWYVDEYAASLPVQTRIPLSSGQVAAMNAPARIAGASEAVTVALHNFVLRHRPSHADLLDERLLHEAVYWWIAEQAPLLRLDDRLVTPAQIDLLAAVERGAGTDFPCTIFMALHMRRHPALASLDLGLPRDRAALLAFLVLQSFLAPWLLHFLPREALRRLLRSDGAGGVRLDAILGRLAAVSAHQDIRLAGRDIRFKGERLLAAAGLSLKTSQAAAIAPRAASSPRPGVALIGPLSKSSGLGRAMRLSLAALEASEEESPAVYDFGMANPAPGGSAPPSRGAVFDATREISLLHVNAEALPLTLAYGPRHLLAGTYRIGFFFWELNEIPQSHRLALDLVEEIWVASEFNREIYARATDKPVIRVGMAAPSLPDVAPAPRDDYGLKPDAFVFVASFDSLSFIARKNPLGAIEAFAHAFPRGDEPVQLVLKTQNRGIVHDPWQIRNWRAIDRAIAADARILLLNETLAFDDLVALLRACNAYVSLHRAEGCGFGLVEAMQLGLPVICTGGSGNADFCTPETAYLVDYDLIAVAADEYIYVPRGSVWAEPSMALAAAHMRHVVADRAGAARKAQAARAFVATNFGLDATARRYAERLAAIRGRKGAVG